MFDPLFHLRCIPIFSFCLAVTALWLGCGRPATPKQAGDTGTPLTVDAQPATGEPADLARHIEEAVDSKTQMVQAAATTTNLADAAADFRELKRLLPERIQDYQRNRMAGERTSIFGLQVAQASASYQKENGGQIQIQLNDAGSLSGLAALIGQAWGLTEYDQEDENGFERTIHVAGYRGYEKYDQVHHHGEIVLLVEDRFILTIQGQDVELQDLIRGFKAIDLSALIAMKIRDTPVPVTASP